MKQKIVWILALFMAQNVFAIKPNEQIKQNIDEIRKSYEQLLKQEQPRLWIHVRTEQQQKLLQHIAEWIKPITLIKIEQPIQLVKEGPKQSKLRFFSSQDANEAKDLLKKLQKIFPQLELQDMSSSDSSDRQMSGRYELWLSPDVKKITLPEPPGHNP